MSTRALYRFISYNDPVKYNVYKHHDGYPSGASEAIANAMAFAWPLPRFESDEFAAAFVAANKSRKNDGGGVRLMASGGWREAAPLDIEYVYIIGQTLRDHVPNVRAFSVSYDSDTDDFRILALGVVKLSDVSTLGEVCKHK